MHPDPRVTVSSCTPLSSPCLLSPFPSVPVNILYRASLAVAHTASTCMSFDACCCTATVVVPTAGVDPSRIVSAFWQIFLQNQLVRGGEDRVLASRMRDVMAHDLGRRAAFIDVVAPGALVLMRSARWRLSHALPVSGSVKHVPSSSPTGAFTKHITGAPIGSVLPAGTVAAICWS